MRHAFRFGSVAFGVILLAAGMASAVKTPAIFGDNMVLQQGLKLPVWGTAAPGEAVTVSVGAVTAKATAGEDGRWRVELAAVKGQGVQPLTMTIAGATNTLTYTNVLLGEVWVCSGQSNMEFPLSGATNAAQEIAAATQDAIRLFKVEKAVADKPQDDVKAQWVIVSTQSVKGFSAIGYLFAREVHQALGVPVGMIGTYWGGTLAQAWTSRDVLEADPVLAPMVKIADESAAKPEIAKAAFDANLKKWEADAAKAKAAHGPPPHKPSWVEPARSPNRPANLFNAMLAPLIPFAMRGALWYQGESNAGMPEQYARLFPAMINDWRTRWGEGDFPFYFVQLAGYNPTNWPWLRESQQRTLSLSNSGMAVAIDVGNEKNIHPVNKQTVSHRLAVIALHDVYGKTDVVCHGPEFDTLKVEGKKARLSFRNAEGLCLAVGVTNPPPFLIAGADRHFVPAQSKIEGETVTVWNEAVAAPVAVRYAWSGYFPGGFLYNKAGLPMPPFRTDSGPYDMPEGGPAPVKAK